MNNKERFYQVDPQRIAEQRPIFLIKGNDNGSSYLIELKATKLINAGRGNKNKEGVIIKW